MRCNPLRWLVGGVLVIGLLGIMNLQGILTQIEQHLQQEARNALDKAGLAWAEVEFSGRDSWIGGQAPDEEELSKAYHITSSIWGVRKVSNRAGLIEEQRNYVWRAHLREDKVKLLGYVPNEQTRKAIIGAVKATFPQLQIDDNTRLARGAPDTEMWLGAVSFGLKQLSRLKPSAEISIDNQGLEIEGEAQDFAAFRAIKSSLAGSLPQGLAIKRDGVVAPKVDPYVWAARLKANELQLGGFLPSEQAREEVFAAAQKAFPQQVIVDRMRIASGEPDNVVAAAIGALTKLAELEEGDIEIKGKNILLSGVAAKEVTVAGLRESLKSSFPKGFRIDEQIKFREPTIKPVTPYKVGAEIDGDIVKLTGYAPSEELRAALREVAVSRFPERRVADELQLGSGAPDGWQTCMAAGLTALGKLGNGRVAMEDGTLRLAAVTQEEGVAEAIRQELRAAVNRACELDAKIVVDTPPEPDLKWRAAAADGQLILEGEVPTEAAKATLAAAAAKLFPNTQIVDRMEVKAGHPDKWVKVSETGLKLLARLRTGEIRLDGQDLTVTGQAPDTAVATLVRQQVRDLPKGYKGSDTIEIRSDAMIWAEQEAKRKAEAEERRKAEEEKLKAEETRQREEDISQEPAGTSGGEAAGDRVASGSQSASVAVLSPDGGQAASASLAAPAGASATEAEAAQGSAQHRPTDQSSSASTEPPTPAQDDGGKFALNAPKLEESQAVQQQAALPSAQQEEEQRCQDAIASATLHGTINFERASTELKTASVRTLSNLVEVAEACPHLQIRIEGHADAEGSPEGNQALSERRAEVAVQFLISKGVSADKIRSVGYGATRPVAPNDTPESRALNRRVEIIFSDQ